MQAMQGGNCNCTANTQQQCKEAILIIVPTHANHIPGNWDGTTDTRKQCKEAALTIVPDTCKP